MAEIKGIAARTAGWSMRHRALAVIGWLVFVAGTVVLSGMLGTVEDETSGNHGESARAQKLVEAADFPERSGEMVLVRAKDGRTVDDPEVQAALADLAGALDGTGVALDRSDPIPSEDRSAALAEAAGAGVLKDARPLREAARLIAGEQQADGSWRVDADGSLGSPATLGACLALIIAFVGATVPSQAVPPFIYFQF
jgi:RND superfamily putative drug exporter